MVAAVVGTSGGWKGGGEDSLGGASFSSDPLHTQSKSAHTGKKVPR